MNRIPTISQKFARVIGGILAITLFGAAEAAAADTIKLLAVDNYHPFSYRDPQTQQAAGIYVRIIKQALSGIADMPVEIEASPWRKAVAAIAQGKAVGVFPAYVGSNEGGISVYSAPIITEVIVAVCGDAVFDSGSRKNWPDDYLGLTIGRTLGSTYGGSALSQLIRDKRMTVKDASDNRSSLKNLFEGEIDCVMTENLAYLMEITAMGEAGLYDRTKAVPVTKGAEIKREQAAIGFMPDKGKYPYQAELINRLNGELAKLEFSGRIADIIAETLR